MTEMERQTLRRLGQSHILSPARPERTPQPVYAPDLLLNLSPFQSNQTRQRLAQACPLGLPTPALCPYGGACHTCPLLVQAKLTVNQPGDVYEQEADRVAEAVLRMPEPEVSRGVGRHADQGVQRQACPECNETVRRQPLPEEEKEEEELQRQTAGEEEREEEEPLMAREMPGQVPRVTPGLEAEIWSLKGGGQPLPESERAFFEPRFGYDFSQVRVHTDARAAKSALALNAQAFTSGHNLVFASGRYNLVSGDGRKLLAHELAHVIQQNGHSGVIYRSTSEESRKTIVDTALSLENEHYLIGAAGQIPDQGGGLNNRKVLLNQKDHAASIDVYYGKEKGTKKHVCGGRYRKVDSLPIGDPENVEHHKDFQKYKWQRVSDGEKVFGEACEGKRHFDCGGFVSYCYHQACPEVQYPGPASNLLTKAFGWTEVEKEKIRPGDVAYRSGHAGLCINKDQVISALGKKWGVHKESTSKYNKFGYLECLKANEEAESEVTIQKKEEFQRREAKTTVSPSFPITGFATCYCDIGDVNVTGGKVACGRITCPDEIDLFAAWPNLNDKCRKICKEGPNVPRTACGQSLTVLYGGKSVSVAVKDCGPRSKGRVIDLSLAAAKALDPKVTTCRDWGIRKVDITFKP